MSTCSYTTTEWLNVLGRCVCLSFICSLVYSRSSTFLPRLLSFSLPIPVCQRTPAPSSFPLALFPVSLLSSKYKITKFENVCASKCSCIVIVSFQPKCRLQYQICGFSCPPCDSSQLCCDNDFHVALRSVCADAKRRRQRQERERWQTHSV